MKIIFKFFSLCFTFLILILNNSEFAYGIGNVDWVLLKENNDGKEWIDMGSIKDCLLYTSPSPRDLSTSRMPSSA